MFWTGVRVCVGKRRYAYAVRGRWVNWVKAAFEEYFLLKMKGGVGMPWFEKLGLRMLFGLSILQSLQLPESNQMRLTVNNQEEIVNS
jgi:sulfide:quinone oxidoreductase